MSPSASKKPGDFESLALLYLDGLAAAAQVAELENAMREDQTKRRRFAVLARQHGLLIEVLNHAERTGIPVEDAVPEMAEETGGMGDLVDAARTASGRSLIRPALALAQDQPKKTRQLWDWMNRPWPVNLAASFLLVVSVFGLIFGTLRLLNPPKPTFFAQLVMSGEVIRWGEGSAPTIGTRLGTGRLHLEEGLARVAFDSGAEITLEGPAELDLKDAMLARLERGRLSAHVSPLAKGFTVDTPAAQIVDLGTTFGVEVDARGDAEVHVFKGLVELAPTKRSSVPPVRLTQDNAKRLERDTGRVSDIISAPGRFNHDLGVPGLVFTSPGMRALYPAPTTVVPGFLEDDRHLMVFLERNAMKLNKDVTVSIRGAGVHQKFSDDSVVRSGTRVRSYLIHCDPVGQPADRDRVYLSGTVRFDQPILGVIVTHEGLLKTDKMLGSIGTIYATPISRGLEGSRGGTMLDAVIISDDRKSLTLTTQTAPHVDQVRVLVAAPSPKKAN